MLLAGSFGAAVVVGVLTWGTLLGLGMLGFAFATHVFSAVDAIRQNAFPGFGRVVPTVSASAGLGVIVYAPALALASVYAWPIALDERPDEGYLIDRRAYHHVGPRSGETVWLRSGGLSNRSQVGRVVAEPGQRVEWDGDQFRVDEKTLKEMPFPPGKSPAELNLTIPDGHRLVIFLATAAGVPRGWEIVEQSDIRGRAWARSYPIWERTILQ